MNKTTNSQSISVKEDVKNVLKGFKNLQEKFGLTADDATTKQIYAALKYITEHMDEPSFPTAKDQAVIDAAIKIAQKASNDENLDLSRVYGKLI